MKLAATVLALLLIAGGVFVWKRNRPAYDMRQALKFNAPIEQIFDPSTKWRSCDFEAASRTAMSPSATSAFLNVQRETPESFTIAISSFSDDAAKRLSRTDLSTLVTKRITDSNEVWLGTCHFASIPKAMHVQMLFTPDARLAQATPVYVDDIKPNGPRLEAFHDSR